MYGKVYGIARPNHYSYMNYQITEALNIHFIQPNKTIAGLHKTEKEV